MSKNVKITGTTRGYGANADVDLSVELTLRDLFAAFALAGMLANSGYHFDAADDDEERAAQAYSFADSMIEARANAGAMLAAGEGNEEDCRHDD